MGRPRTPSAKQKLTNVKAIHPERISARSEEPKPTALLGKPPRHLDREEKKVWKELAALCPPGVLTNMDRLIVETTVLLLSRLRSGEMPATALPQLIRCLSLMGMTPVDRSKVSIPKPKEKDDGWSDL